MEIPRGLRLLADWLDKQEREAVFDPLNEIHNISTEVQRDLRDWAITFEDLEETVKRLKGEIEDLGNEIEELLDDIGDVISR